VGYQGKGTPGAAIQTYGPKGGYVELDGRRYEIKAGVETLGGYSAHADRQELVDFVMGMNVLPTEIRLVHGEARARKMLKQALESRCAERAHHPVVVEQHRVPRNRYISV
jgi:metallo-beta-lactamase family protein